MKRIAICDDERYVRESLCKYVKQYAEERGKDFEIYDFSSGEELIRNLPVDVDIIFLDIKMGELNGMNTARKLREQGNDACLIFVTSMVQYAIDGYEVHAFAFLEKPLEYDRFASVLSDALMRQSKSTLVLRRGSYVDSIPIMTILYIETLNHTSVIVTENGHREYAVSLKTLTKELQESGFDLCHKSFLVSFRKIQTVRQNELVLTDGTILPLSKHRRKEFLEAFTRYMGVHK